MTKRYLLQSTTYIPPLSGGLTAANVSNTPAGDIAATDVQAAINELDTEKLGVGNGYFDRDWETFAAVKPPLKGGI